jgi:FkbM family methyltransferase
MYFSAIRKHIDHFRKFGFAGNLLLINKSGNKNSLNEIKLKNYPYSFFLRNGTSDIPTFYKIFYNKEYNVQLNLNPKVILDLGANVGLASIFFSAKYPQAKIIAVEPEKVNFQLLVKNTESNSNISCLNYGVWNRVTNLEIKAGYDNWGFRTIETDVENDDTIRAISIDKIMADFNLDQIDILKIDIEGSEKELFEKNYEKWLPKTKWIIIELHDEFKKDSSKSFFRALINYDFNLSASGENFICELK